MLAGGWLFAVLIVAIAALLMGLQGCAVDAGPPAAVPTAAALLPSSVAPAAQEARQRAAEVSPGPSACPDLPAGVRRAATAGAVLEPVGAEGPGTAEARSVISDLDKGAALATAVRMYDACRVAQRAETVATYPATPQGKTATLLGSTVIQRPP